MMVLMTKIPNDDGYHASLNDGILANLMSEFIGQLPCMVDDCIGRMKLFKLVGYHASLNMIARLLRMESYHASERREKLSQLS